jgi:ABC-type dipeptide/oligopeptide/nickel transport system permease component
MAQARAGHQAALLDDGRVLIAGGTGPNEQSLASAEVFDPKTALWSPTGAMRTARAGGFTMTGLPDHRVLVAGGFAPPRVLASAELFDPATGTWTEAAPMSAPRAGHAAGLLVQGVVLVTGGNRDDSTTVASTEAYDPAANVWRTTAPMVLSRASHSLLVAGRAVMAAGGFSFEAGATPTTAETFDSADNRWSAAPDPPFNVAALAPAPGGRALAFGSRPTGQRLLLTAFYSFQSRQWTTGSSLTGARPLDVVVGLPDGRVLITGGMQGQAALEAASIYDPAADLAPSGPAAGGASLLPAIPWQLFVLAAAIVLLAFLTSRRPRLWPYARPVFSAVLQIGGLLALTWTLVHIAGLESPPISSPTVAGAIRPAESALLQLPLGPLLQATTTLSLTLAGLAAAWATAAGVGGAVFVVSLRRRYWEAVTAAAALLWVAPTFLLAILVQELQAFIYGHSGLVVAAGFGDISPQQVFWASIVLGLRPAAYLYRHTRDALEGELRQDYARTAMAKGLSWRQSITRHVVRASAAGLMAPWLNSFRLMIGALPLVEFFFGYPGLGRVLILALGLTYNGTAGVVRQDVIVALVVTMGVILVAAEAVVAVLRHAVDPRLRELRPA